MRLRFKATHLVLAMLCVMYFITYVDRVNISTAASEIQKELGLSNKQLGLAFSAFAYPPLVAGYVIDVTGNWYLPFLMSMGLLLLGGFSAFLMHPETPFEEADVLTSAGRPVAAGLTGPPKGSPSMH
jgi:sugar phosphate permease